MELKDVVLSALAELENAQQEREQVTQRESLHRQPDKNAPLQPLDQVLSSTKEEVPEATLKDTNEPVHEDEPKIIVELEPKIVMPEPKIVMQEPTIKYVADPQELRFLQNLRERILVLFEGFQSPNNVKIEAKVDLILNFLEYTLASIDERSDQIKENQ